MPFSPFSQRLLPHRGYDQLAPALSCLTATTTMLLLFLCTSELTAATYYVAKTGDNANPGTELSPWLTIQKAADTMAPNDTVIIAAGVYAEKVVSKINGTSTSPITFRAASLATVVGGFRIQHAYQVIQGFTLDGFGATANGGLVEVTTGGNNLTVSGCTFDSSPDDTIYQLLVAQTTPPVTGVSVIGNSFINGKFHAVIINGSGHLITNNVFSSPNGGDAIRMLSSNTVISYNTFSNWSNLIGNPNHPDLIQSWAMADTDVRTNVLIEGNLAIGCEKTQLGILEDWAGLGNLSDWTYRNNVFVNVNYVMSIYAQRINFYNNTFYRCGQNSSQMLIFRYTALRYPFTTADVSVVDNTITLAQTGTFLTGDEIKFYNTPPAPLTAGTKYFIRVLTNTSFSVHPTLADATNNTNVIDLVSPGSDSPAPMGISQYSAKGVSNNGKVYNNIFFECGLNPANTVHGWYSVAPETTGFTANHNLVVGTGAGQTKAGFQTRGWEDKGINGRDPLFVNAISDDYRIQVTSPCLGSAWPLIPLFNQDRAKAVRGTSWDIGAYEYDGPPINARVRITTTP